LQEEGEEYYLKLLIENTGANLSRIGEITVRTHNPIIIHAEKEKRTTYEIQWHLEKSIDTITSLPSEVMHPPDNVRGFYAAVRNRMRVHFKKQENKMAKLAEQSPKEYIFLQKINAIIMSYMGDENFNVEKLAQSIAMSRMQLHRRLKPLVNQAPAQYIRDLRLIKAKEMIENSDLSIGDICFNVGFISQSHFTRVFVEKYGVRPLAYRKGK
jgi:AraC-like DNA-binding protein